MLRMSSDELRDRATLGIGKGEPCRFVLWRSAWERLLAFGDIPNERENGEEFLGRNHRPEQTQMVEEVTKAVVKAARRAS